MVDDLEENGSEGLDFEHYLGVARRRHLHFLIPLFLGWALVWGASWVLPPRYQSSTLILVEQPTMPSEYVKPNVNDDLQDRLQSITQQILSRTRLLHIIEQINPYAGERVTSGPRMRKWTGCGKTSISSWCGTNAMRSRRSTCTSRRVTRKSPRRSPAN